MKSKKPQVLCLSRSYLARLLPTLGVYDGEFEYLHIVQTDKEERAVTALGGKVVLNIQRTVREALSSGKGALWKEPEDMRELTGFKWSAISSDRYLVHFNAGQRLKIAGALQEGLEKVFADNNLVGFLSEPVALFVTHFIFYLCKRESVKPLLWCNTYFADHFYFAEESEISSPVRYNPLSDDETRNLHEKVEEYVTGIIGDSKGPVYHHAFSGKNKDNHLDYFKQRKGESPLVMKAGWVSRVIQVVRLLRAVWHRVSFTSNGDFMTAGAIAEHKFYLGCLFANEKIYNSLPDSGEENVVYPLQYEPEASLLYFAPHVVTQPSFVETVLKAMPADKVLWVKEHPNQFGALDRREWRDLKSRYGNLRFIHGRENGRELIKRSSLVVTISSSMGMDALLLGRKLLVAGNVFYDHFTGATKVNSYLDLCDALNSQESYHLSDNAKSNTRELVEFGKRSYEGDPQPSHYLYDEKNLKSLVAAIQSELRPLIG